MWEITMTIRVFFLVVCLNATLVFGYSLGRPMVDPRLSPVSMEDIKLTERIAWSRDYNNFVEGSDHCFDRAVDVIGELNEVQKSSVNPVPLQLGSGWNLTQSNVAKIMLVFPFVYQVPATDGRLVQTSRWAYHMATIIRGTDQEWHPVDPDRSGLSPQTAELWVQRHAWDAWRRPLAVTRSAVGAYYQDLPPMGQVYFYWLPATYFQPGFDTNRQSIQIMFTKDPIFGRPESVAALRSYRFQMKSLYPGLVLSSVDLF